MKKTPIWFSASSFTLNLKISSWQPFYTILTINKCGKCIELALGFLFVCTKSIFTLNRKKTFCQRWFGRQTEPAAIPFQIPIESEVIS